MQTIIAMRAVAVLLGIAFPGVDVAYAALGGIPEQYARNATAIMSIAAPTASNFVTRTATLDTGTQVREYVDADGIVFAVAWQGPFLPDLKVLLGKYFDTMVAEAAKAPRAGRASIAVKSPEVVINSSGHMRSFRGSAWLPGKLPPGFSLDHVR